MTAVFGGSRMDLIIRTADRGAPGSEPVEVVERKGLGHPDSICDGIAERVCVRLCRHYLDRFGVVLHHNVDKVLLVGGAARARFGGGEIVEPIEIYLAGRATAEHEGQRIPIHDIAVDACREWLGAHLRGLDLERDVRIVSRLRQGSTDLRRLFARASGRVLSNDTACGIGFAPFTDLEKSVLAVEHTLNSPETRRAHPEIGEDIKVMGVRHDRRIELTISCAFVDRFVFSLDDYADKKAVVRALATEAAQSVTSLAVEAALNVADDLASGDVYLTVTGTSSEAGDDGEVGRGNRVSGLITPYRAMTLEATAGKNPVSHVGKLYNVAAARIASAAAKLDGVEDTSCILVSQIGRPIDDPQLLDIRLVAANRLVSPERAVGEIVRAELDRLATLRSDLISERVTVY